MEHLKYIGNHQPKGMIVEVEDKDVKNLLNTKEWELLEQKKVEKTISSSYKYKGEVK